MNWQVRTVLAGVLAAIGLYVTFNPVSVTSLVAGIVPWLLVGAGAIYLLGVVLRKRVRPLTMILPGLVGVFLVYAGLSLKFGDPRAVGPIGLPFLFALVLIGGGLAKLLSVPGFKQSRYFLLFLGSGAISVVLGLITLFNWAEVSAGFLGVVLGLELIADAAFLVALALRERDKEDAKETLGIANK
ncbi:hypothetical protein FJQ54_05050 [Sandaracinobacter neustonicus]|uniref:DUF308 domain-containing protein n=1 Tax=Sandaracinobacter neustonicus TaxID=1715348 RepID=A0A501XS05_9SPHN|nr:DUF308 domain-containing protein [Sandaracinobacter neustonicus]TPE62887.1 hypothetical protein FJQ54_05050 [Sandaracinobacter neustonicus]